MLEGGEVLGGSRFGNCSLTTFSLGREVGGGFEWGVGKEELFPPRTFRPLCVPGTYGQAPLGT